MKYALLYIFMTVAIALSSTVLPVIQDGQGQFVTIQSAINASANGDTVLVYPGTYYENVNYAGRSITIASLELTTGNSAYRDSTIIDGNNSGSCVRAESYENNARIYGFTITHGSGMLWEQNGAMLTKGGGFRLKYTTNFRIENCIITNNKASMGGGIQIIQGTMALKGTLITANYASSGGGIMFNNEANCLFDSIQRSSIYENYAGEMNDIGASESGNVINVVLNTFTVNPPTSYYAYFTYSSQANAGHFEYDILNAYRTEVNHDLYVSANGSDDNDGLTVESPLKSITKALHSAASDSLSPKTIHIATGIYSSVDGQVYPLAMKAYVKLIGDSLVCPTIYNERYEWTINGRYANNFELKNLIVDHGTFHPIMVMYFAECDNSRISNIAINPVNAVSVGGMMLYKGRYDLNNITLNGITSDWLSGMSFWCAFGSIRNASINNCHVIGDESLPVFSIFSADLNSNEFSIENMIVSNCTVVNPEVCVVCVKHNMNRHPRIVIRDLLAVGNASTAYVPIYIGVNSDSTSILSNCTFAHNSGGSSTIQLTGRMDVSNCIFDNNRSNEIYVRDTQVESYTSHINFYNNLIHGYPGSIYIHPSNSVTFNEYNIAGDPGFVGADWTNPLSYRLGVDSPCIDAGTADTTGLYLPEYDLAGHPRMFNGIVDMGCYEWDGTPNQDEVAEVPMSIRVFPNPVITDESITFTTHFKGTGKGSISIYNLKGQRVKTLSVSSQHYTTAWDTKDESGNRCAAGVYLYRFDTNTGVKTGKLVLVQ